MNTTRSILLIFSLVVIQDIRAAELPAQEREPLIVVGSPPTYGTIEGIAFEHRSVHDYNIAYDLYICYRDRRPSDFMIGERIEYGYLGPVTATEPEKVIDRILLTRPTGEVERGYYSARAYYEVPKELYRDVTQPALGKIYASKTYFSLVRKGFTITIFLQGGDGAYSYIANWIIDLKNNRVRRVLANGERDEGLSSPWHALKKIEKPKIVNTPNKEG
jgi:hypothetical protein